MKPLKRLQMQYGSSDRAYLNSYDQAYDQLRPEIHSPSFNLPKIETSLPSIRSSPEDGLFRLEHYVHKLMAQEHENVLRLRRQKRAKKEEQARREYQKQRQSIQRQKERLYMQHLQEHLKLLKREQKAEEIRLAEELALVQNYRFTDYKSSATKTLEVQDAYNKKPPKIERAKKHTNGEKKSKQKKPNLKRKFRIVAFAVYFAFAFKKYGIIFRQIRKRYFYQQIVSTKILQKQTQNFVSILNSIKANKYIVAQMKKQPQKSETFTFTQIDEKGKEYQMEISLSGIAKSVLQVLKLVKQLIKGESLNKLFQALSFYFSRRSFLCDSLFLLDELYRLQLNPGEQSLLMGKQMQTCLLLNYFISKAICFKFMLTPISTQNNFKTKQQSRREKTLLMGGLYLFNKCNQVTSCLINDNELKSEGNMQLLDKVRFPKAMQQLQISEDYNFECGSAQGKRISIEENIRFSYLNNYGIKYKNMEKAEEFVKIIIERSTIEREVSELVSQIGLLIHQKSFQFRKKHFQQIRQAAIDYKYYLTREVIVSTIQVKRLPNQIKTNEYNISLFVKARSEARKQSMRPIKVMSLKAMKSVKQKLNSRQNVDIGMSSANAAQKQSQDDQGNKRSERVELSNSLQNTSRSSAVSNVSKHKGTRSHEYLSVDKENLAKATKYGEGRLLNKELRKKQLTKIDEVSQNKE